MCCLQYSAARDPPWPSNTAYRVASWAPPILLAATCLSSIYALAPMVSEAPYGSHTSGSSPALALPGPLHPPTGSVNHLQIQMMMAMRNTIAKTYLRMGKCEFNWGMVLQCCLSHGWTANKKIEFEKGNLLGIVPCKSIATICEQ